MNRCKVRLELGPRGALLSAEVAVLVVDAHSALLVEHEEPPGGQIAVNVAVEVAHVLDQVVIRGILLKQYALNMIT